MNSYFTVKVKYQKQLEDGTFKRVTESYLVAAMSFTDAESRIYEELGSIIRGEFMVTGIVRTDFHDIFHYEDADVWYKCKITYESGGDGLDEGSKAKKISQNFLITAHSVKDAHERLKESLGGMMIDYVIPSVSVSPIVDVFPFGCGEVNDSLFEIAKDSGYTIFDGTVEKSPNEGEEVLVIFNNGSQGELVYWDLEEGFDAQTEPHHIGVYAWKRKEVNTIPKEYLEGVSPEHL